MPGRREFLVPCVVAIAFFLATTVAFGSNKADPVRGSYAFVDVSVIPMDRERVLDHQTVVISGDRIVRMGAARSIKLTKDLEIITGKGRYLLPGLADMHVHLESPGDLPVYLANGVTLVRNMWGTPETLRLRNQVDNGSILGPTIVTAGAIIDGDPPLWPGSAIARTPAQARSLVAEQKAAGYDFIKVYSRLAPEVFDAIATASRDAHMPFAGHVPFSVSVEHAMREGMASIEHLTGFPKDTARSGIDLGEESRAGMTKRIAIGKRVIGGELTMDQVFDSAKTRALGKLAVETGTWLTPTLIVTHQLWLTRTEIEQQLARHEMRYIDKATRSFWNPDNDRRRRNLDDDDLRALQSFFPGLLHRVAVLHQEGAPLLAGTDASNPYVFPGFSLHEELELLVRAGLTPYEAIMTATLNPARFLGLEDGGTIAEGNRADLLLLSANPLQDVNRLRHFLGVMAHGRWLPEQKLQGLLRTVAEGDN